MSLPRPGTLPSPGISSAPDSPTASWHRGGRGPECGNRARGHPAVPAPPVLMLAPSLLGAGPGECRAGLTWLQASGDPFWSLLPQSKAWAGGGTAAPHAHSRTGGMSRRGKVLVHAEASGRPGGRTSARWPFWEGPLAGGDGQRAGRTPPPPSITTFSCPRPTWPGSCYQAKLWPQLWGLRPLPPRVRTGQARAGTRPAPPRPPRPALGTPQWGKPSPLCLAQSGLQTCVQGSEKRVVVTPLGSRSRLGSFEGAAGSLGSPRPVPPSALRDGAGVSHPCGQPTPTRLPASADFRRPERSQKSALGVTRGGEGSLGGLALRLAEVASLSSATVHRYPQTDALLPQRDAPLP